MATIRAITATEAWTRVQTDGAEILDLRTAFERRQHGWPPGSLPVSLLHHAARPRGPGTIYLCQHANRSKLTLRRGAVEIQAGWAGWLAAGLPVQRR